MRAYEFLIEDRSQAIDQVMGHKVLSAYEKKKSNDPTLNFTTSLEVLKYINSFIPDTFMKWVVKQYIRDQYFFLHDLEQWKELLTAFIELSKDKRFEFNKNIDAYQDINQLRNVLSQLDNKREEVGSKFYDRVINGLNKFVEAKQANWLYRGNDYSIYQPLTWESSNILSKLCDNVSACTIINSKNYKGYTENGILYYTISQDNVYVAYLPFKSEDDEFSDKANNHSFDLAYQTRNFPKLFEIIKELYNKKTIKGSDKFKFTIDPFSNNPGEYAFKYMAQASNYKIPESLYKAFEAIENVEFFRNHIRQESFNDFDKRTHYSNLIYRVLNYLIPEEEDQYTGEWDSVVDYNRYQQNKKNPIDNIYEYWFDIEKCGNNEIITKCKDFVNEMDYFGDCSLAELNSLVYEMSLCTPEKKKYIKDKFLASKEQYIRNEIVKFVEEFNQDDSKKYNAASQICNLISRMGIQWFNSNQKKFLNNIGDFETVDDLYQYMENARAKYSRIT